MRRCVFAVCVATMLGGWLVRAQNTYLCATVVSVDARSGALKFNEPIKMQCAAGESISVTFVNEDTHPHLFAITSIGCKDGSHKHNPAKRFIGVPIPVPAAASKILDESFLLFFRHKPAVLGKGDAAKLKCDKEPWVYEYTIQVGDADNINNHTVSLDPDLEISPAP